MMAKGASQRKDVRLMALGVCSQQLLGFLDRIIIFLGLDGGADGLQRSLGS
jgi:hypothetical protein